MSARFILSQLSPDKYEVTQVGITRQGDWFTGENAVLALGGGYDDALLERFEATLAELPTGTPPVGPTIEPQAIKGRQVLFVDKEGADASISFGFPIDVKRGERDFYALWIANSWLGEHRNSSSHLYSVIRETRGMNYGDYSYIEAFPFGGFRQMPPANVARNHQIFQVWIRTLPNDQALFALRAALRELQDLIDNGMTEEEFELTRSFLSKYYLHFAETTQSRLGYRVDDAFYGIEGDGHLAQFREMMASITREEVNAALAKYLQYDNMVIAMVTGQAEELAAAMAADAPSPMSYPTPKSDEVLEEDKVIESWPLIITDSDRVRTLTIGLGMFVQQESGSDWSLLMAATLFVCAPIIVFFLATQKTFIRSFLTSGIKG